jgi:RNA polymerase sigma-70 factor (ECF subfamily)
MRQMTDNESLAGAFEEHRNHLRAVAYRLLGSLTDADDAVQDTWLRLASTDASEIENLGGWLTTVVARVSLNMLRSRQHRREQPVGDSWPGAAEAAAQSTAGPGRPAPAAPGSSPEDEAELADSVGLALLVVLDALTPAERLAFVLHDLFGVPFIEVAATLGRSAEAARQLASRARRRVRGTPDPGRAADLARQRQVAAAFLAASREGDFSALVALLDSEVTLTGDSFAVPSGRPVRLQGAEVVAKGARAASGRAGQSQLALVGDGVGIVFAPAGRLQVILALTVSAAGKITAIDVIADPARLRQVRLAVLPD